MNVLVLNAGSSSLKFQLIATDREHIQQATDERICRGEVERIGGEAIVTVETEKSARRKFTASLQTFRVALEYLIRWIASEQSGITQVQSAADIHAVGHRVVHGGERFTESAIITDDVLHGIEDCIDLRRCTIPTTSSAFRLRGISLGRKSAQWRCSIPRFIIRCRNRRICMRCRITCTAGITSGDTGFMGRRTGTWRIATE